MIKFINKCSMSNITNCWKAKLGDNIYAIMPAHVAIYKTPTDTWKTSQFLKNCGDLDWFVSQNWKDTLLIKDDFAWAKVKLDHKNSHENNYFSETILPLDEPIDGNFYFNQPYDMNGKLCRNYNLGKVKGTVYPSPKSSFLESIGIGFRGMSGAICVDDDNGLIGMFVRRGHDLGTYTNTTLLQTGSTSPIRRGIIIPPSEMLKHIENNGVKIT